jgi:hypothetical protein
MTSSGAIEGLIETAETGEAAAKTAMENAQAELVVAQANSDDLATLQ